MQNFLRQQVYMLLLAEPLWLLSSLRNAPGTLKACRLQKRRVSNGGGAVSRQAQNCHFFSTKKKHDGKIPAP